MSSRAPVLGIDLGGTNTLACVMDSTDTIVARTHRPTAAHRGTEAVIDGLAEAAHEACGAAGISITDVGSVGIAVCGAVDHRAGIVLATGALNWKDVPLSKELQNRLQRPIVLENDVNAAAWGEYRQGAGAGAQGMLAAWIGTGIGGGIVLNDQLYHGPRGTAGELGQMMADTTGRETRIVEAIASRTGMRTLISESAAQHPDSTLLEAVDGDVDAIDTHHLASAFAADDALANDVVTTAADVLGSALANAVTLLSIDTVVVGGGMTEALGTPWMERIRKRFDQDVFPPQAAQWCRIVPTALAGDAGLVGAAMLATEHLA